MKVQEFLMKELNVSLDELKRRIALGPPENKLCLDGDNVSLGQEMPECELGALFRVGKHLFAVKQDGLMKLSVG
jgi:hypothetical protein